MAVAAPLHQQRRLPAAARPPSSAPVPHTASGGRYLRWPRAGQPDGRQTGLLGSGAIDCGGEAAAVHSQAGPFHLVPILFTPLSLPSFRLPPLRPRSVFFFFCLFSSFMFSTLAPWRLSSRCGGCQPPAPCHRVASGWLPCGGGGGAPRLVGTVLSTRSGRAADTVTVAVAALVTVAAAAARAASTAHGGRPPLVESRLGHGAHGSGHCGGGGGAPRHGRRHFPSGGWCSAGAALSMTDLSPRLAAPYPRRGAVAVLPPAATRRWAGTSAAPGGGGSLLPALAVRGAGVAGCGGWLAPAAGGGGGRRRS